MTRAGKNQGWRERERTDDKVVHDVRLLFFRCMRSFRDVVTTQLIVNDTAFKAKKTDSIIHSYWILFINFNDQIFFKHSFLCQFFLQKGKFHNVHVHYPPPQKKWLERMQQKEKNSDQKKEISDVLCRRCNRKRSRLVKSTHYVNEKRPKGLIVLRKRQHRFQVNKHIYMDVYLFSPPIFNGLTYLFLDGLVQHFGHHHRRVTGRWTTRRRTWRARRRSRLWSLLTAQQLVYKRCPAGRWRSSGRAGWWVMESWKSRVHGWRCSRCRWSGRAGHVMIARYREFDRSRHPAARSRRSNLNGFNKETVVMRERVGW